MAEVSQPQGEDAFSGKELAGEFHAEVQPDLSDERTEELVDARLSDDPHYSDLDLKRLSALNKGNKAAEKEAVEEIKALREKTRIEILGLPEPDMKPQDKERLARLQNAFAHLNGGETDRDVLNRLGMFDHTANRFRYPEKLFSPLTDEAWERYVVIVKEHNNILENARELGIPNDQLEAIDRIRVVRHNEFSRLLMQDLGLDDTEDNFYQARRLAVKMRDATFPNAGELKIAGGLAKRMLETVRDQAA